MVSKAIELAKRLDFMAEVSDDGREPDPSSVTRQSSAELRHLARKLEIAREALVLVANARDAMNGGSIQECRRTASQALARLDKEK